MVDFLGTRMMVADLKIDGMMASEVLKMSVSTWSCWSAHSLSNRPGMLSGPAAFWMLTLLRVFRTLSTSIPRAFSSGWGVDFLTRVLFSASNRPKCILILYMYIVQEVCVVLTWWIPCHICLMFVGSWFRLALADQSVVAFPDLNAAFCAFSKPHTLLVMYTAVMLTAVNSPGR